MPSAVETVALFFAGLGFFFIGVSGLKTHLQQLANRNFRRLIAQWMQIPGLSAFWGFVFGAITQSSTVVAFILSGFVSGGLIKLASALPVIGWANIGTTLLVFVAAFDIKIAALYIIGVSSLAVTFNFAGRHKALLQSLYSVGLLFFGLRTMREAFVDLPQFVWFPPVVEFVQGSDLLAFAVGALLRLFIQSSSAIVVLAITFSHSGLFSQAQSILLTFGTGLGVAISSLMLSGNLRGVPRQIVLFQVGINALAALLAVTLATLEKLTGAPLLIGQIAKLPGDPANHIAFTYLGLQALCLLFSIAASHHAPRFLARISPITPEEDIATPQFLLDEALDDPETALTLVEKEQHRALKLTAKLLPSSRQKDAAPTSGVADPNSTHKSLLVLLKEIRACLLELVNAGLPPEPSETLIRLERRQNLMEAIEENCFQLAGTTHGQVLSPQLLELESLLVESLDSVLLIAADAADSGAEDDINILLSMTGDRGEMMKSMRSSLLDSGTPLETTDRSSLFHLTSLFERLIWLCNQLGGTLGEKAA